MSLKDGCWLPLFARVGALVAPSLLVLPHQLKGGPMAHTVPGGLGVLCCALTACWTTSSSVAALLGGEDARAVWFAVASALAIWGAGLCWFLLVRPVRVLVRHPKPSTNLTASSAGLPVLATCPLAAQEADSSETEQRSVPAA